MKKAILIAIVFIFLFLGAVGFWYWNKNPYSKEVLKIEVLALQEADFSQEVEYVVKYKNNGDVRLEELRLIFEFPEYTISDNSFARRKEIGPEELGDLYPGEERTYSFKGRLFGKEGDLKTAKVWLSYQPKNLSARYESQTTFSTKIKEIPLTFGFDLPSRIETNKEFGFSINYYSILDYPLSDLDIKVEYPEGFEFLTSLPNSISKDQWNVPILNKAEGGRIDIRGKVLAELGDLKIFKAQLGFWREGELVIIKEISKGVEITKPYINISQKINNQQNYIASAGELLHYEISFKNVGEEPFRDLFLVVRLDGKGFDLDSVKATNGQLEKGDNTIIWEGEDVSRLRFLDQGEEGKVEFWVNLKNDWQILDSREKDAVLKSTILVSKMKQEIETKINSKIALEQEAISSVGPIFGQESSYNITWKVKNYFNDAKNVKVKAKLPLNVNLTGEISPSNLSSNFSFDSQSREIVWLVGDMEAGDGILNDAPTISFKVVLNPNMGQIGDTAVLTEQARIIGEDTWTERFVEQSVFDLRTGEAVR